MYKLKENIDWLEVKNALTDMWFDEKGNIINDELKFGFLFQKVELPVIYWNYCTIDNDYFKIQSFSTYLRIAKYNDVHSESLIVCISEHDIIKSVAEFNEKCALFFGFYLKEVD